MTPTMRGVLFFRVAFAVAIPVFCEVPVVDCERLVNDCSVADDCNIVDVE